MFNLKNSIIPTPQQTEDKNNEISLGFLSAPQISVKASGSGEVFNSAIVYLEQKLTEKFAAVDFDGSYIISVSVNPSDVRFENVGTDDAYIIDITPDSASLIGYDEGGAYYAATSFVQLIHYEDDEVFVPECTIVDYPRFKVRGHFMESRYGSDFMTLDDWMKGLDYFSEMKINTVIASVYGCWTRQYDGDFAEYLYVPINKYPRLRTPRNIKHYSVKHRKWIYKKDILPTMFADDYFGDMVAYGKKKNIDVIPLFNSWGHNTLIPRIFPEISAKNEDGSPRSLGFCTNNEKTFEVMFDIYDEIIDRYLVPNGIDSFEIGMDEIRNVMGVNKDNIYEDTSPFCKCPVCSKMDVNDIMLRFIIRLVKHLKEKGMKNVYIYHDMLFSHGLITRETAEIFKKEGIYDVVVIDWWSYTSDKERLFGGEAYNIEIPFRSVAKPITGYYHWSLHTHANGNMYVMSDFAQQKDLEGMIAYGAFDYCYDYNFSIYSQCVWNPDDAKPDRDLERYCIKRFGEYASGACDAIRLCDNFMKDGAGNYCKEKFNYYMSSYLFKDFPYPQHYPSNRFAMIAEDEEKYLGYLADVLRDSDRVYRFFEDNISSGIGQIWRFSAYAYRVISDEFLTIYRSAKAYIDGSVTKDEFAFELKRLIEQRESLMLMCEDTKITTNQYIPLRNMTIMRQFMIDLLKYLNSDDNPVIDICDFWGNMSRVSKFLR